MISGDTVGDAVTIKSAVFDATPGTPINTVNLGSFIAGDSVKPVGGSGLIITNALGDLRFSNLDINAGGDNGLQISGLDSTLKVTIDNGKGSVTATKGRALSLNTLNISAPNLTLKSTNSTTSGAEFLTVTGSLSTTATSASSTISGSTQTGLLVNGGSAVLDYKGTIAQSNGRTVEVHHLTGGSVTINGAITGSGTGVYCAR